MATTSEQIGSVCTCGHTAYWHNAIVEGETNLQSGHGACEATAGCTCERFVLDYVDTVGIVYGDLVEARQEYGWPPRPKTDAEILRAVAAFLDWDDRRLGREGDDGVQNDLRRMADEREASRNDH